MSVVFKLYVLHFLQRQGQETLSGLLQQLQQVVQVALFWMWNFSLFGMATKYSEGLLAIRYRQKDEMVRLQEDQCIIQKKVYKVLCLQKFLLSLESVVAFTWNWNIYASKINF